MTDVFTKEKRSWIMSRIRSKDTKIENLLASELKKNRIKFKRYPKIFGKPDFLVTGKKIVVFVDGCFFHKCPLHYKKPASRIEFWQNKIKRNVERDKKVTMKLSISGYRVVRFWEHEVEKSLQNCIDKLKNS